MKATELRIGNYVFYEAPINNGCVEVHSIKILTHRIDINGRPQSYYKPIPLTEEIILKCSFSMKYGTDPQEQNALKVFSLENLEILKFELDKFFFFSTGKGLIHTNIKYLHQLQNLYFALTGQELEINL